MAPSRPRSAAPWIAFAFGVFFAAAAAFGLLAADSQTQSAQMRAPASPPAPG